MVTIGSFDGVHLGHQAILRQLKALADCYGLPSVAVIFEPQPLEYFSERQRLTNEVPSKDGSVEEAPARLMRLREKIDALFAQGVDRVCCLPFNRKLRGLSAQQFVQQVLVDGLGSRALVVGDDFRFGCDRGGDFAMLQQVGIEHGFEVVETRTVSLKGERVSSTRIRHELEAGHFDKVKELLGRPYTIGGRVVHGQKLGKRLGVPTANVHLHRYRAPLAGVFAVEAIVSGKRWQGVANVGVRPTVSNQIKPILEVHLLDWQGDLYGQRIAVEFKLKVREEKKFASFEALRKAIEQDIKEARSFFKCDR